ncbi:helix-turn-helix domain-containing protein [Alkalilacustris brevis]|uniref:helix-turn-helix domain-containing protein n=1 Tax=Alkalilacustris brevis TaxID=2026338 RepID=UPI000E0DEF73|nr:helix-turn-helix domain-containing protein [Alkalilacustris brevis]
MSNHHINHVFKHGPRKTAERMVLLAIADRADARTGCCDPSMADIAERCGFTQRGARKIVRRLETDGWLEVEVARGRGNRSRYRVILLTRKEPEDRNEKTGTGDRLSADESQKTGTGVQENRNGGSPEPLEPFGDGGGARALNADFRERKIDEPPSVERDGSPSEPQPTADPEKQDCARQTWREELLEALGVEPPGVTATGRVLIDQADMHEAQRWERDLGLSRVEILEVILEVMAARRDGPPRTLRYFRDPMQRLAAAKRAPKLEIDEGQHHDHATRNQSHGDRVVPFHRNRHAAHRHGNRKAVGDPWVAAARDWPDGGNHGP